MKPNKPLYDFLYEMLSYSSKLDNTTLIDQAVNLVMSTMTPVQIAALNSNFKSDADFFLNRLRESLDKTDCHTLEQLVQQYNVQKENLTTLLKRDREIGPIPDMVPGQRVYWIEAKQIVTFGTKTPEGTVYVKTWDGYTRRANLDDLKALKDGQL